MGYYDNNSSTPVHPNLLRLYSQYNQHVFGNHASQHKAGEQARTLILEAKKAFADFFKTSTRNVYFGESGTSLNWQVVQMLAEKFHGELFLFTGIEHHSILRPLENLVRAREIQATKIPVSSTGAVELGALETLLKEEPKVVICAWANSEIGTVQNITRIQELCIEHGALLFCDGIGWLGKGPEQSFLTPDILTLSGHKVHAPKGAAALVIERHGFWLEHCARHGVRTDCINAPAVACFGNAIEMIHSGRMLRHEHLRSVRDAFIADLADAPHFMVLADSSCLLNTVALRICGYDGPTVQRQLSELGHAVTVAYSETHGASHVYLECGASEELAREVIRVSFADQNTIAEAATFAKILKREFPAKAKNK